MLRWPEAAARPGSSEPCRVAAEGAAETANQSLELGEAVGIPTEAKRVSALGAGPSDRLGYEEGGPAGRDMTVRERQMRPLVAVYPAASLNTLRSKSRDEGPAITWRGKKEVPEPVRGAGCLAGLRRQPLLSTRRRGAGHRSREHRRLDRRTSARCGAHPDGRQPPPPDRGLPARLPRHRRKVAGRLSRIAPTHRPRQPAIAQSLPCGGVGEAMPTFRDSSRRLWRRAVPGSGGSLAEDRTC